MVSSGSALRRDSSRRSAGRPVQNESQPPPRSLIDQNFSTPALEGEGGVARDDEAVAEARDVSGEILGDAVGEIVLGRIVGEVCERQHDDGKTCSAGRR